MVFVIGTQYIIKITNLKKICQEEVPIFLIHFVISAIFVKKVFYQVDLGKFYCVI